MTDPWIAAVALLSVVTAGLAVAYVVLSSRIGAVLTLVEARLASPDLKPPGLQPGEHVQRFSALRQNGVPLTDRDLLGGISVVLFLKADCVVCRALSRQLTTDKLETLGVASGTYVVVRDGEERDALALDPKLEIVFQEDGTVAWAFRSSATPQAFVVDADGVVAASGFPNSLDSLDRLIRRAIDPAEATAKRLLEPAARAPAEEAHSGAGPLRQGR